MKKVVMVLGAVVTLCLTTVSIAHEFGFDSQAGSPCVIPKLDGDKVPFPIAGANTKFDLVDGETYVLTGYVLEKNGRTYFGIDFASQPWLSTKSRVQRPYFLLDLGSTVLKQHSGTELVQVAVVAGKNQSTNTVEVLRLITPPVLYRTHRK